MAIVLGVALVAAAYSAVAAWLEMMSHPAGSANRRRAATYFASFITRDIGLAWMTIATLVNVAANIGTWPFVAGRGIMVVSHLLIAIALLRGQVLGLNRKLVTGTSGAAAVALLAVAFVLVTEAIEGFVSAGDRTIGIVAAIILTLLFRPLQEVGERGLVRLFPGARPVTAMGPREREAVYREQAELAWADGRLAGKERRMLDRMAVSLGLGRDVADGIETSVVRGASGRS
jgi:hypothetical protein